MSVTSVRTCVQTPAVVVQRGWSTGLHAGLDNDFHGSLMHCCD